MKFTRLYSDENGDSHFKDVDVTLIDQGEIGKLSEEFQVSKLQFRENTANYDYDFHNAPARQFIILLDGEIEITTSLNEIRRFKAGEIILVEDTTGKGHKTRNVTKQTRKSLFIKL